MHVHGADVAAVFVCPDGVQQRFPGVDPVGIAHEKFDDVEFLGGQIGQLAVSVGVPGVQIQGDGADGQAVSRGLFFGASGAAQEGADSRLQLQNVEGLGQVIVRPVVKTDELIHVVALGGEHDDGHVGKLPDFGAGGKPVHVGHHHVQNHQVRVLSLHSLDGFQTVAAGDDLVALVLQIEANALYQKGFVVYH